jgi:hypothetical protein
MPVHSDYPEAAMLHRFALSLVFACLLAMTGCEKSKVTTENFDRLKDGMTLSEVTGILGSKYDDETPSAGYGISGGGVASATAAPENVYVFKSKDLKIIVTMKNGKIVQKTKQDI